MKKRRRAGNLVRYIDDDDSDVVLNRVPAEFKTRLRDVFTWYRSGRGVRVLGWVGCRGRRDLNVTGWLPPRVSLGRFITRGVSATEFGAPARGQWPPWAVRRYLLYDVLLHELGHIQVVHPKARNNNRKYASETLAQSFADDLRGQLWANRFDHPDPVHNQPTADELAFIPVWQGLDKARRRAVVDFVLRDVRSATPSVVLAHLEAGAL